MPEYITRFSHILEPVPTRDWIIISTLFIGILILIAISEFIRRRLQWSPEFTRKLVHILVGVMMFFIPILLQTSSPMVLIATFFIITNLFALKKGVLKGMHGARESYGTAFYPLSFLILVLLCWPQHVVIIIAAMMVLALGDAAAAIVGEALRKPHEYILIKDQKSYEGSATMFLTSGLAVFQILYFYPFESGSGVQSALIAFWFAIITAIIATAAEALSGKGSDNLTVPLFTALILYYLLNHSVDENIRFSAGVALGIFAAIISFRLRFLSASGAVATFLLASIRFGFGGWKWTVPILTFFILSSLLSKVGKKLKSRYDLVFEKSSRRDFGQVLANGGIAGILMILYMFYELQEIYILYLAALATAAADTWATEIGTLARSKPRLITNFSSVPAGTSGGITLLGIISATLGALTIAISGWLFFSNDFVSNTLLLVVLITFGGVVGSLIDSLFGATIQIQYRCPDCQQVTEKTHHCQGKLTNPVSGISIINNDMVNFLSSVGVIVFLVGYYILTS